MKKDAYYFPHDSNAKDDPKCMMLIEQLGLEGYGIFWVLVETLRDQPNYKYPLALLPAIARRYNTTFEKVKTVVYNYNLFQIEDPDFFSISLNSRMKSANFNRLSGIKGALKKHGYLTESQLNNMSDSQIIDFQELVRNKKVSPLLAPYKPTASPPLALERKGKERKRKENNYIDFYQNQIEINSESKFIKEYKQIFSYLSGKNDLERELNEILGIEQQLTYIQFEKLFIKSKTKKFSFKETLMTMTNKRDYYHKKTSLYLTLNGWINRSNDK